MPKGLDEREQQCWHNKYLMPWTAGEIWFLRWAWQRIPVDRIVRTLLRSEGAIREEARRCGLVKRAPDSVWRVIDIAARLNVIPQTVSRWLMSGRLCGIVVQRTWVVTDEELRDFERRELLYLAKLERTREKRQWLSSVRSHMLTSDIRRDGEVARSQLGNLHPPVRTGATEPNGGARL